MPGKKQKHQRVSTNKIYAGIHWSVRKEIKDICFDYAKSFCRPVQRVESYPVSIRYRFLFRQRPLDTLNTAFFAKCIEDSLVSLGIIKDDSPEYITQTIIEVPLLFAKKNKKAIFTQGTSASEKIEDWLEITINPYKTAS